jgi:hypothetical protein
VNEPFSRGKELERLDMSSVKPDGGDVAEARMTHTTIFSIRRDDLNYSSQQAITRLILAGVLDRQLDLRILLL